MGHAFICVGRWSGLGGSSVSDTPLSINAEPLLPSCRPTVRSHAPTPPFPVMIDMAKHSASSKSSLPRRRGASATELAVDAARFRPHSMRRKARELKVLDNLRDAHGEGVAQRAASQPLLP